MNIVWATAVAAVAYFLLGAVWFTPLFGRAWDRSIGHDRTRDNGRFPLGYYLLPLASTITIAVILSALHTPAAGAGAGALLGAGVAEPVEEDGDGAGASGCGIRSEDAAAKDRAVDVDGQGLDARVGHCRPSRRRALTRRPRR